MYFTLLTTKDDVLYYFSMREVEVALEEENCLSGSGYVPVYCAYEVLQKLFPEVLRKAKLNKLLKNS